MAILAAYILGRGAMTPAKAGAETRFARVAGPGAGGLAVVRRRNKACSTSVSTKRLPPDLYFPEWTSRK